MLMLHVLKQSLDMERLGGPQELWHLVGSQVHLALVHEAEEVPHVRRPDLVQNNHRVMAGRALADTKDTPTG